MEQGTSAPAGRRAARGLRLTAWGGALGVGLGLLLACGSKGPADGGAGDAAAGAAGEGSSSETGGRNGSGGAVESDGGIVEGTGGRADGLGGLSGFGGQGGASGEDEQRRQPCDPTLTDCSGEAILHVSPLGADSAAGSVADPLRTVGEALERAAHSFELGEAAPLVYACATAGAYVETLEVGWEHGSVGIFGGFDCELFETSQERAVFLAGQPSGHRIASAALVTLGDLRLESPQASAPGESSTALSLVDSTAVRIVRSDLVAGDGAPGQSGVGYTNPAQAGAEGNRGNDACEATDGANLGGPSAVSSCGPLMPSVGGEGGPGQGGPVIEAGAGAPGQPAGGSAGTGAGEALCTDGGPGDDGLAGAHGLSSPQLGLVSGSGYLPPVGEPGRRGTAGKGGGGGGGAVQPASCATGASGGSGGGGGCAGGRATGGHGGGGSFGLLSVGSQVDLAGVSVVVANGGVGGAGGDGQLGGEPGAGAQGGTPGAALDASSACAGGSGGRGGNGGSGGGGAGGPSIGVAYLGTAPVGLAAVLFELPAAPASGGVGGLDNAAGAGPVGVVEPTWSF